MSVEDDSKFEAVEQMAEQQALARQEAVSFIQACITEVAQMGANDYEPWALLDLQTKLHNGEITPQEARSEAAKIIARKNSYH